MMSAVKPKLRVITYMCPSHPVELYEHLLVYLEEQLQCEASLIYESRATGPLPDRTDPFTEDSVDLGALGRTQTLDITREGLCPDMSRWPVDYCSTSSLYNPDLKWGEVWPWKLVEGSLAVRTALVHENLVAQQFSSYKRMNPTVMSLTH